MGFSGWPAAAITFYEGLEDDNSKAYWTAHKDVYDAAVHAPMVALLAELDAEFGDGKIFRPNRDVRFSADKSPYKTAIGAILSNGGYVQLSADGLMTATGYYVLAADQLERYRQAVADDTVGPSLEHLITELAADGVEVHSSDRLKSTPRGYVKDHPRIELLRNKNLIAGHEFGVERWLHTADAKDRIADYLRAAQPLSNWLETHVGRSELPGRGR